MTSARLTRRRFLQRAAAGSVALSGIAGILHSRRAPAVVASDAARPMAPWGLQIGDVIEDRAIVWSRADRPARLLVEWARDERFADAVRVPGPDAVEAKDFTARVDLTRLPENADVFVRVVFEDLASGKARSEPLLGRFRTPPANRRNVRFVWSGDTAGQGWGIDLKFGGMRTYEAMRLVQPDFFIHSGDTIYADGPLQERVTDREGNVIWTNAHLDAVPEKLKVAETLREFRRNYLYNRYDLNVLRFSAEVPQIWQWDDHEVTNNWSDGKVLDERYTERDLPTLKGRARQAFLEYAPMRWYRNVDSTSIHRRVPYGPDLDVFVIDMRSFRGPNSHNRQERRGAEAALLGRRQVGWLKQQLARSRATWKVIASDMPLGLLIGDGKDAQDRARWEGPANGNGPPLGRELEIADLLRFIKRADVRNVLWITADVHYCAAHYYDPEKAQFQDFNAFWEFVAGPLHAGSFGPGTLDDTFGPRAVFHKAPPTANTPPSLNYQFFGQIDIDADSRALTATLKDVDGPVFSQRLNPLGG
jgi:alkaline phosphatase D